MFHFMSSLVTWDVVILELIVLRMHVWLLDFYHEILHFESNILQKNRVSECYFKSWLFEMNLSSLKRKKVMYPCPLLSCLHSDQLNSCHQLSIVQIRLFVYMIIDQTVSYIFGRGIALLKSS
jgi:hypothetical protein